MSAHRRIKFRYLPGVLVMCLALCSCGASGPAFTKAAVQEQQGVIYFYRLGRFMVGTALGVYVRDVTDLVENGTLKVQYHREFDAELVDNFSLAVAKGKLVANISSGGYYPLVVAPGTHRFILENSGAWGETRMVAKIDVMAGQDYYVTVWIGGGGRRHLAIPSREEGAEQIKKCRLVR